MIRLILVAFAVGLIGGVIIETFDLPRLPSMFLGYIFGRVAGEVLRR